MLQRVSSYLRSPLVSHTLLAATGFLAVLAGMQAWKSRESAPPPRSKEPLTQSEPGGRDTTAGGVEGPSTVDPPFAPRTPAPAAPPPDEKPASSSGTAPSEEESRRARAAQHLAQGIERLDGHDPKGALADLVYAAELDPTSAAARERLGIAYLQLEQHALARGAFLDALDRDARLAAALEGIARIDYSEGRFDDAIARLTASLEIEPDRKAAKDLLERVRKDAPVESGFREVFTQHFRLKVEGALDPSGDGQETARRVGDLLESAYNHVGGRLAQYPARTIPVVLYADRQFYEVTGAHPWIGGLFDGKIRIPVKDAFQRDATLLDRVCRHEYTHAVIQAIAPRCPRWLHEGTAKVMEGDPPDRAFVAAHARAGLLPAIAKLDQYFAGARTTDQAKLVYETASCFVGHLFASFGAPSVAEMLRALGEGQTPDDAARRAFGAPLETLDQEWRATLGS